MFISLYDNSNIDCNKKVESKICDLYDIMNRLAWSSYKRKTKNI